MLYNLFHQLFISLSYSRYTQFLMPHIHAVEKSSTRRETCTLQPQISENWDILIIQYPKLVTFQSTNEMLRAFPLGAVFLAVVNSLLTSHGSLQLLKPRKLPYGMSTFKDTPQANNSLTSC